MKNLKIYLSVPHDNVLSLPYRNVLSKQFLLKCKNLHFNKNKHGLSNHINYAGN